MRKLGVTSLYILAILEKYPDESYVDFIDTKLAEATARKSKVMPAGQTNMALRRMEARKLLIEKPAKPTGERGRPRIYFGLSAGGRRTLKEIRDFIT
jgi:DNA-binding PadR family transcriptional regulator